MAIMTQIGVEIKEIRKVLLVMFSNPRKQGVVALSTCDA